MAHPSLTGALAIKGIGSQGDGSVQLLCESALQQKHLLSVLAQELKLKAFPLTVPVSTVPVARS